METTFDHNVAGSGQESLGSHLNERTFSFAELEDAWRVREAWLPVAVVTSIADDLLQGAIDRSIDRVELEYEDVLISADGFARARDPIAVRAIARWIARALGLGAAGDVAPASARALFASLDDDAIDGEQLRERLRQTF